MRTYDLTPPNLGSYTMLVSDLAGAPVVHTGEWQTIDTRQSKAHATRELEDVTLFFDLDGDSDSIIPAIDQPWAKKHFAERVSGKPMNPAPSHVDWPYAVSGNAQHTNQVGAFDHTYPERFWPKHAGLGNAPYLPVFSGNHHQGIRFAYGDLSDVVDLMVQRPLTRQAFLPVWFPEDTGAGLASYGNGKTVRVPCTLGYHFMVRDHLMSVRYYLRSCDIYRHFSNDVYFASELLKWVCAEVNKRTVQDNPVDSFYNGNWRPVQPSRLVMHIASLHMFEGDSGKMRDRLKAL